MYDDNVTVGHAYEPEFITATRVSYLHRGHSRATDGLTHMHDARVRATRLHLGRTLDA